MLLPPTSEVSLTAAPKPTPAYAVLPSGAKRGMVIIHEIFGRQPEIDLVAERFADAGYAAIAPDLFAGGRFGCIRQVMGSLKTGARVPAMHKALWARDWLCDKAGLSPQQIGIIGFCFGGGFALLVGNEFAAVSTNYGEIPETEVMRGIGPVIACYGGRDKLFRDKGTLLNQRLQPLGKSAEVHVYPNAGHAFLTDGNHPIAAFLARPFFEVRYDAATADDAWRKIMAFFEKNLPERVAAS